MRKRLITALVAALAVVSHGVLSADFGEGLRAYDAGDYATARDEWLALARRGDVDAQVAIAGLYRSGLGLPQSDVDAAEWYGRAAENGHAVAQVNLAEMYSLGRGVRRDLALAMFWLSLAAEQGHAWAREQGDKLAARLSDDDRVRAERLLADWRAGGRATGGP